MDIDFNLLGYSGSLGIKARFDAEGDGLKTISFDQAKSYAYFGKVGQDHCTLRYSISTLHRDFHLQPLVDDQNRGEAFYKINTVTGGIDGNSTDKQQSKFFTVGNTQYVMNYGVSHASDESPAKLGDQAYLYISTAKTDWMKSLVAYNPTISQLAVAGAHDAGMWQVDPDFIALSQFAILIANVVPVIGGLIALVGEAAAPTIAYNMAVTQKDQPGDLLKMGIRHFDFRPAKIPLLGNRVSHVHGPIPGGKFSTFLEQVNQFLKTYASEVVFVEIKGSGITREIATFLTRQEVEDFLKQYIDASVGYQIYEGNQVADMNQKRWNDVLHTGRVVVMYQPSDISSYSDGLYGWSMTDPSAVEGTVMNTLWSIDASKFNSIQCQDTASTYFVNNWSEFAKHPSWYNDIGLSGTGSLLADTKPTFDQRLYARLSSTEAQANLRSHLGFTAMINDFVDTALVDLCFSLTHTRLSQSQAYLGGTGGNVFSDTPINQISSLQFKAGAIIDAVMINGSTHGGNGGSSSGTLDLRSSEIQNISYVVRQYKGLTVLGYIKIQLENNQSVSAGENVKTGENLIELKKGQHFASVISLGGQTGDYVDQLSFKFLPLNTHPIGGDGGGAFASVATASIQSLTLKGGSIVDAIVINGTRHGGTGGAETAALNLSGSDITQIDYIVRQFKGSTVIGYLKISSSNGQSIAAGAIPASQETLIQLKKGQQFNQITALGGQAGSYLDQLLLTMM